MTDRYPGYDVLAKRDGPSWNDPTRRVVEARLAVPPGPRFFTEAEWSTLGAVCDRIVPQEGDTRVNLPAQVDDKMLSNRTEGFRYPGMPAQGEAWRRGLAALDEAARAGWGRPFADLTAEAQADMLHAMQDDSFLADALGDMSAQRFFNSRVLPDVVSAFYAHPTAWSEIGWGGPASPRGYVRLQAGMNDPWEPVEAEPGKEAAAARRNRHVR